MPRFRVLRPGERTIIRLLFDPGFFTTLSIERRAICEENRATAKERNFEMGPRRRWNSWLDGRLGLGGKKSNSGFRSRSLQIEEEDNIAPFLLLSLSLSLSLSFLLSFPFYFVAFLPEDGTCLMSFISNSEEKKKDEGEKSTFPTLF